MKFLDNYKGRYFRFQNYDARENKTEIKLRYLPKYEYSLQESKSYQKLKKGSS